MTQKYSKLKNILKKIGVIAAIVVVAYFGLSFVLSIYLNAVTPRVVSQPYGVVVGGTAIVDDSAYPVEILFTKQDTGGRFVGEVDTAGSFGYYEVQLPSGSHDYQVQIAWVNVRGGSGICDVGIYSTPKDSPSGTILAQNFECP